MRMGWRKDSKDGNAGSDEESLLNPTERELERFSEQAKNVQDQIEMLPVLMKKTRDANEESKAIVEDVGAIRHKIEGYIQMTEEVARVVGVMLHDLEKDNSANRAIAGCEEGSVVDRARTSTTHGMREKLDEMMSCFETLKKDIQKEHREYIRRKYYIVTGLEVDEKTIDQVIESGDDEQIIEKAIEEGHDQIRETYTESADKPLLPTYPEKRLDASTSHSVWQEEEQKANQLKSYAEDFRLESHPWYCQKWFFLMVVIGIGIVILIVIVVAVRAHERNSNLGATILRPIGSMIGLSAEA